MMDREMRIGEVSGKEEKINIGRLVKFREVVYVA